MMVGEAQTSTYQFGPTERPIIPGGPYLPAHPPRRRIIYVGVALLAAITATLGNALVNVNVTTLAGSIGEYVTAVALLPALYVAMSATGNLALVKARMRFGVPVITQGLLIVYVLAGLVQLLFPGFASAAAIRIVSGITGTALTAATMYYLLQVFPPKARPAALVVGIGLIQLGTPLARLFPVEMLAQDDWRGLRLMELALPLATLAVMQWFPLPQSDRSKPFEPLDFVTTAAIVPAMLLFCVVLATGRLVWWTDTPWIGWALAAAAPLFAIAIITEMRRARPLLQLEWIGSAGILRFAAVALLIRLALAEQTYGAVGLLTSSGLTNDQLRTLFAIVLGAMILGILTAVVTLRPGRIRYQVIASALIIAFAAWLDSHATNQTRPEELYLSQALIGFGTTLFIGPALAYGFLRMMERGPAFFLSLVVLFSTTQNVGGLAGAALLGSYQTIAAREHALVLSEDLTASNPQVAARIRSGSQSFASVVNDPAHQAAQGGGLLFRSLAREANILAFNNVFQLVMFIALSAALVVSSVAARDLWTARRRTSLEAQT
jgi:hypothetical protein